jgi:putative FmdB family regulatory protein
MARYDYQCGDCELIFEVEKPMSAPHPDTCPKCDGKKVGRYFSSVPNIGFPREIWRYNDCKGYKTATHEGVTVQVDPNKQGDLKSSPGKVIKKKK